MTLLFQLARSVGRCCTMLSPFGGRSCRYLSFKFGPRCNIGEERNLHYRSEKKGESSQSTKQAQAEKQEKKEEMKPNEDTEKQMSMWEHHARMYKKCPDITPRMDDLYYTASDIDKRVYKQTWIDYPDVKMTKKVKYDISDLEALSDPMFAKPTISEAPPPSTASTTDNNVKPKKSYMNSYKD